jgi:shikimate dehydrogenase
VYELRLCYLIGYPLDHSMSAVMHNTAFKELRLNYRYELLPVKPEELGSVVSKTLRRTEVIGVNVTIPHKIAIIKYLDDVDDEAAEIGAVNTIVNEDGRLKGYNTDRKGAMRALTEVYGELKDAKAVMIGAGGAARAIGSCLSTSVSKLSILNRDLKHAKDLAEHLSTLPACRASVSASTFQRSSLKEALEEANILVNATPIGMAPNGDETPVEQGLLNPRLLVFDTIYNPPKTRLLREAEMAGARILSGINMLVYQGAASFELWTKKRAPEALMMGAVRENLGVKE